MQFFKNHKKELNTEQRISRLEEDMLTIKLEWESLKNKYNNISESLPNVCRDALMELAQNQSIYAATKYREKEFLTKLVADETKELKAKRANLKRAIEQADLALASLEKAKNK